VSKQCLFYGEIYKYFEQTFMFSCFKKFYWKFLIILYFPIWGKYLVYLLFKFLFLDSKIVIYIYIYFTKYTPPWLYISYGWNFINGSFEFDLIFILYITTLDTFLNFDTIKLKEELSKDLHYWIILNLCFRSFFCTNQRFLKISNRAKYLLLIIY